MDAEEARTIGRRIGEIRGWRQMSLKAVAELAGISESYLSRIERGERGVHRRSLLEAIAAALRVAPSELAEQAFPPAMADPVAGEAQAAVIALEAALSDYAAQGLALPGLLSELHTLYVTDPEHRADVLRALMDCYQATGFMVKNLGIRGLPALAALRARQVAEELDDPAWLGLAAWLRALTLGGKGRPRMLELSVQGADALDDHLGDPRAQQMYGALHLSAALAAAAMCRGDDAADHLNEAGAIAGRIGGGGRGFGSLYFGPDNVGIWRLSIAVELGEPGRAHM